MTRAYLLALCALCSCCRSQPAPSTDVRNQPATIAPARVVDSKRVIVFAGDPVDIGGLPAQATSEPPLPAGLSVDNRGHLVGAVTQPIEGRLHRLAAKDGTVAVVYVEILAGVGPDDRFVAPRGNNTAEGTIDQPYASIAHAIDKAVPGTRIFVRAGRYAEDLRVRNRHGKAGKPIVIRGYPRERAQLEGVRILDITWTKAQGADVAPDEWVSAKPIDTIKGEDLANRGVFFQRAPYTRLLTYSRIEDFRAANQKWTRKKKEKNAERPLAYFGPGIFHDRETGLLRLRLSPTTNGVPNLADYDGPADPAKLELGVWRRSSIPIVIDKSSFIEFRDLDVVGGGGYSVRITDSSDVRLDHLDIRAAAVGLSIVRSSRVKFTHGRIDGGIPSWTFRSDYKDSYEMTLDDGTTAKNDLIRKTSRGPLHVGPGNREIEISYCEIENGHDNTMAGVQSSLHHCRIRNIHDDALFISHTEEIDDLRIHDNVFERIFMGLSGEGRKATGTRYVYDNLYDLREPTASFRPGLEPEVWRYGHVFKGDFSGGPLYFYQNSILLNRPGGQVVLALFKVLEKDGVAVKPRWFVNNVVAVDMSVVDKPFGFMPATQYLDAKRPDGTPMLRSDGNLWVRLGSPRSPMFHCMSKSETKCAQKELTSLDDVRQHGLESRSKYQTTLPFAKVGTLGSAAVGDDMRLRPSTGVQTIELPKDLPGARASGDPGALPPNAPRRFVGVDGKYAY